VRIAPPGMAGFSPDEANVLLLAALLQPERLAERLLRVATETGSRRASVRCGCARCGLRRCGCVMTKRPRSAPPSSAV